MSVLNFTDKDQVFNVLLPSHILDEIKIVCAQNELIETGGILIGKYSENASYAIIKKIGHPPVDSSFGPTWFKRGIDGLSKTLRSLWKNENLYYLGEWHYHPHASPEPSSIDKREMQSIALDPKYNCKTPLMLIMGGDIIAGRELLSLSVINQKNELIILTQNQ